MKGVLLTGHGGLDKLEIRDDIPVPEPGRREVLIRVAAAAVNNTDINTRTAWYSKTNGDGRDASWAGAPVRFPRIQGIDVCGHIVAVGEEVDANRVGERVLLEPCLREAQGRELERPWFLGSECDGGFAEFTAVASRHAYRVESAFNDTELSSFPCSYSTAENLLTRSRTKEGDRVLVTGASGGVGSAAVQLARARGAKVVAVTGPAKAEAVRDLGAQRTFHREDSLAENLGRDALDVVIDLVAGPKWPELLEVLRPGGRYAVAGAIGGPIVELDVRSLYLKDLSLFGCTILEPEVFANLIRLIEKECVRPLVAETFSLEQIADAQSTFMTKKHVGKIVLTVGSRG
jgi:NADPH:quinone reductase-like Zn-dependent oxidoreductase